MIRERHYLSFALENKLNYEKDAADFTTAALKNLFSSA